jgi:uncharacterized protein YjbJ (UPF0337 family)
MHRSENPELGTYARQHTDNACDDCDPVLIIPCLNPRFAGARDSAEVIMKSPSQTATVQSVPNPAAAPADGTEPSTAKPDNVVTLKQPKPTADSGTSTAAGTEPVTVPNVAAVAAPVGAAKGDDEVMRQPAPPAKVVDDPKAKWARLLGPAKLQWDKLTDAELLKTEGNEHRLATLVQQRYDIPRGDAYRQVKSFHEKQKA